MSMKALILAAGYATRLYPLTKEYPKPLLEIKGKPIIEYITDKLNALKEIEEILVITNSKFFPHFQKWRKDLSFGKPVKIIDDLTRENSARRGAVGDIDFAVEKEGIKQDLLVVGGDNIFDEGLDGLIAFASGKEASPVIGAYDVGDVKKASKYGVLKLDAENKIIAFEEKAPHPLSSLAAMCLYYFPAASLKLLKEYMGAGNKNSDTTGSYIDWLRQKTAVYGYVFGGRWYDIGEIKFYNEAKLKFRGEAI